MLINFSRPNTPPEKESLEILSPTNNPSSAGNELNLCTVQSQAHNPPLTNEANEDDHQIINQSIPHDNMQTLEDES